MDVEFYNILIISTKNTRDFSHERKRLTFVTRRNNIENTSKFKILDKHRRKLHKEYLYEKKREKNQR